MRALVYDPGREAWEAITAPTDAIVEVDAAGPVTHHLPMDEFLSAYDVCARAGDTRALQVVLPASA